jgi:hypothetical protein
MALILEILSEEEGLGSKYHYFVPANSQKGH